MCRSIAIMIVILATAAGLAGGPLRPAYDEGSSRIERAGQVINQARAAIGGEAKLRSIRSLSAYGKLRRVMKNIDQSGKVELNLLLPDKFKMATTMNVAQGIDITMTMSMDGDQVSKSLVSNSPGALIVPANGGGKADKVAELKEARETFTLHLLAWALTAPPSAPLEFTYAGEAEAEDGQADVLDVKGSDGLEARLFFDKKTHRLLMLSYQIERVDMSASNLNAKASITEMEKALKEARAQARKEKAEVQVYFSDYRQVDGIYFPHHLLRTINAQPSEEWELAGFKINPDLNSEKFLKK